MAVRPRRRYVALLVEGGLASPGEVEGRCLGALRRVLTPEEQDAVKIRVFQERRDAALVRIAHTAQARARVALDGLPVGEGRIRTVAVSGTMREARAALGIRASARRRPRKPRLQPQSRGRESGPDARGNARRNAGDSGPGRGQGARGKPGGSA